MRKHWCVASVRGKPGEFYVLLRFRSFKGAQRRLCRLGRKPQPISLPELLEARSGWVVLHDSLLEPIPTRFELYLDQLITRLNWQIAVMEFASARQSSMRRET